MVAEILLLSCQHSNKSLKCFLDIIAVTIQKHNFTANDIIPNFNLGKKYSNCSLSLEKWSHFGYEICIFFQRKLIIGPHDIACFIATAKGIEIPTQSNTI